MGGTGKVGRYIAKKALESGCQVRMLVRNPDKLAYRDDRIQLIRGDVQNINFIRILLKDCNIVINTFGQSVKALPLYSSVPNNVLAVMHEFGIKRCYRCVPTIKGDNKKLINRIGAKMLELLFPKMMTDKRKELHILANSEIDWTLVRLPFVVQGSETGNIKESLTDMPGIKISNADIARFIIDQIHEKKPFISS